MEKLQEIFIEVTNHCYQHCLHCSSCAGKSNYPEISLVDLTKIVDSAMELGLERMTISGGEPFLYPYLQEAFSYFHAKGLASSIYTCGVIKDKKNQLVSISQEVFESLVKLGLKRIIFSLHGYNWQLQDYITGVPGSFDLVMHSLDNALRCGVAVELHTVPMNFNLQGVEKILQLASQKGIQQVSLLRFVPQGRGSLSMEPSAEEYQWLKEMYPVWQKQFSDLNIRMGTPFNCLTFDGKQCTAGKNKILINAFGEYFPCEAFKYMHGNRPTIYSKNIKEIWFDDPLLNMLRTLSVNEVAVCNTCVFKEVCKGGCPGQRMHRNGNLLQGPDPSCLISSKRDSG